MKEYQNGYTLLMGQSDHQLSEIDSLDAMQVTCADGVILNGNMCNPDGATTAVIDIHGFTFSYPDLHGFQYQSVKALQRCGIATVLAEIRGTGLEREFDKSDGTTLKGGAYFERLEEAHLDIDAYVARLKDLGFERIILSGHSLGGLKCSRYLFEGMLRSSIDGLILLGPFDPLAYMECKFDGQLDQHWRNLSAVSKAIEDGFLLEIVPTPDYEDFPVSYQTYMSWYNQTGLARMYDFSDPDSSTDTFGEIEVPSLVVSGESDDTLRFEQLGATSAKALSRLAETMKNCTTVLIAGENHTFDNDPVFVAKVVAAFVTQLV